MVIVSKAHDKKHRVPVLPKGEAADAWTLSDLLGQLKPVAFVCVPLDCKLD